MVLEEAVEVRRQNISDLDAGKVSEEKVVNEKRENVAAKRRLESTKTHQVSTKDGRRLEALQPHLRGRLEELFDDPTNPDVCALNAGGAPELGVVDQSGKYREVEIRHIN